MNPAAFYTVLKCRKWVTTKVIMCAKRIQLRHPWSSHYLFPALCELFLQRKPQLISYTMCSITYSIRLVHESASDKVPYLYNKTLICWLRNCSIYFTAWFSSNHSHSVFITVYTIAIWQVKPEWERGRRATNVVSKDQTGDLMSLLLRTEQQRCPGRNISLKVTLDIVN